MRTNRFLATLVLFFAAVSAWAQSPPQGQAPQAPKKELTPDEIIRQFTAKETQFYEAWKEYTYHQVSDIRVVDVNGMPKKERMVIISDIVFRDNGAREVQVTRRAGDIQSVTWTMHDEEVINNLQPFALTDKELPLYDLSYQGKEKVDELTCYVFSVKPKSMKGDRLYFQGKIYVDDQDLQIVRTVGKPVPQKKNEQYPDFETIRQMVDDKYWFPVWTHADSQLRFPQYTAHVEETITYENYKHFGSKATIKFGDTKP